MSLSVSKLCDFLFKSHQRTSIIDSQDYMILVKEVQELDKLYSIKIIDDFLFDTNAEIPSFKSDKANLRNDAKNLAMDYRKADKKAKSVYSI